MSQNKRHLSIRRRLRRDATLPERLLWSRLKRGQSGFSFRRQHSIGPYIVDFCYPRTRLVVEVDGDCHAIPEVEQRDRDREEYFWERGYEVLRFSSQEVEEALDGVWERIGERCRERVELIPPL
jgi:very-short-patch-repair endonuclease